MPTGSIRITDYVTVWGYHHLSSTVTYRNSLNPFTATPVKALHFAILV